MVLMVRSGPLNMSDDYDIDDDISKLTFSGYRAITIMALWLPPPAQQEEKKR